MPELELDRLSATGVVMKIQPGQRFMVEGDANESCFTLTSGTARLIKSLPDGRQQITSFADRGDFLGSVAESHYAQSAEAVDEVRLCRFSVSRVRLLFAAIPSLQTSLLAIVADELEMAHEQILLLGCKNAVERLASFLLMRARKNGSGSLLACTRINVSMPMPRNDIADYLGLRIETISRAFSQLKAAGCIKTGPSGMVTITDLLALQYRAAEISL